MIPVVLLRGEEIPKGLPLPDNKPDSLPDLWSAGTSLQSTYSGPISKLRELWKMRFPTNTDQLWYEQCRIDSIHSLWAVHGYGLSRCLIQDFRRPYFTFLSYLLLEAT